MGDLAVDTAVTEVGEGRYVAELSRDWEIWGPMGGYVAATALRAVEAASPFDRPASFACHYLGVAAFEEVQLAVEPIRVGRGAASHRVRVTQGDRPILEAMAWSIPETEGLDHDVPTAPEVPGPDGLPSPAELAPDEPPRFRFWENFDSRPLNWIREWPPAGPLDPLWRSWMRFIPWDAAAGPWVEAARLVLLCDLPSWPSASRVHAWQEPPFIAPTLDLQVSFVQLAAEEDWLLLEGTTPVGADGMLPFTSRVWTRDGRLLATGGGQNLCRRIQP